MKIKVLFVLIVCVHYVTLATANPIEEKSKKAATPAMMLKVTSENLNINCLAAEDFAARIGTTEDKLNDYMCDLFQTALDEAVSKGKSSSKFFLKLDNYDLSAAGYPYNNFQHSIEYSIYDAEMQKVREGVHRFATFSNVNKEELIKQFRKVSKKVLSIINEK